MESVIERWRRVPPLVTDGLLAVVVAVVTVISVVVNDQQDHGLSLSRFGVLLLAVELVPLVWRRRSPVLVFAISGIAAAWYGIRPTRPGAAVRAAAGAVHGRRVPTAACQAPILVAVVIGSVFTFALADSPDASDVAVGYLSWITVWFLGDAIRTQRERTAWIEARREDDAWRRCSGNEWRSRATCTTSWRIT